MPEMFIGAEVRAGSFTDEKTGKPVAYNNLLLTFVKPGNVGVMANDRAPLVKVKNTREEILRVFGEMITMKWLKDRLNWYADVFYDEKKRIARIMFYGPDDPMKGEDPNGAALTVDEGISDYSHAESAAPVGALDSNKADELAKSPSEMVAENEPAEKMNPVDDVFDNGSFKKGGKK